jgi:MarR family transcriptional regulator, 2-MHQ and catechol-resistance regulon repressor
MLRTKSTRSERPETLVAQVTERADEPFINTARALLKASYLFFNQPGRPLQDYDLTLAQLDVLCALARAEVSSLTCSEIAAMTLITKGGLTGVLDRLEGRGLVERIPSPKDRRSVSIRLSATGTALFRKLYPAHVRWHRALFEKAFPPEQMNHLGELLEKLIQGLEK